jgi:hypothetical protein
VTPTEEPCVICSTMPEGDRLWTVDGGPFYLQQHIRELHALNAELLAALKDLSEFYREAHGHGGLPMWRDLNLRVGALIARAERK